jgi:glycosyltransferase involved in cell wall biosynthesis
VLDSVTPLILTYNEAENIGRTLSNLAWARSVVVLDSGSSDSTLEIVRSHPNARIFVRAFDSHANQWNFGLHETHITTPWVLAMDADYQLTAAFVEELRGLSPPLEVGGYIARFVYCIHGRALRGALYPPVGVLFRRAGARYVQDGHTQRILFEGQRAHLQNPLLHDDRKSLTAWVRSQDRYMRLEAEKILNSSFRSLRWPDRIRSLRIVAPGLVLLHCLFAKGLIFDGAAGLLYSAQRTFAELLLSLYLLESDLRINKDRSRQTR